VHPTKSNCLCGQNRGEKPCKNGEGCHGERGKRTGKKIRGAVTKVLSSDCEKEGERGKRGLPSGKARNSPVQVEFLATKKRKGFSFGGDPRNVERCDKGRVNIDSQEGPHVIPKIGGRVRDEGLDKADFSSLKGQEIGALGA